MTDILGNELVRKYFGCGNVNPIHLGACGPVCTAWTTYRIIIAMQEPIKKDEKYVFIEIISGLNTQVLRWKFNDVPKIPDFHPFYLRLPDRFQEKKECHSCHDCRCDDTPKRDAVEEKINFLEEMYGVAEGSMIPLEQHLRELVRMAKEGR